MERYMNVCLLESVESYERALTDLATMYPSPVTSMHFNSSEIFGLPYGGLSSYPQIYPKDPFVHPPRIYPHQGLLYGDRARDLYSESSYRGDIGQPLPARNGLTLHSEQLLQGDEEKPNQSYIGLIGQAIINSPEKKLLLSDIYGHIMKRYPYFRNKGPGWRNSIRHNLSLNDCFIKLERSANGKGHFWAINPLNYHEFSKGDFRRRRSQKKEKRTKDKKTNSSEQTEATKSESECQQQREDPTSKAEPSEIKKINSPRGFDIKTLLFGGEGPQENNSEEGTEKEVMDSKERLERRSSPSSSPPIDPWLRKTTYIIDPFCPRRYYHEKPNSPSSVAYYSMPSYATDSFSSQGLVCSEVNAEDSPQQSCAHSRLRQYFYYSQIPSLRY